MKHLVTGGNGFLGRALLEHLCESFPKDEVVALGASPFPKSPCPFFVCDLTQKADTRKLILELKPDSIYHLAGSPRVADGTGFPDYFSKNFLSTASLAEALAGLARPVTLFLASSVHVYGNQPGPISEEASCHPMTPYGFTKYLAEELLRARVKEAENFSVVIGRLYSCLGPGQGPGFVAADLSRKIAALPAGASLSVGPLLGTRSFLDVRDAVTLFPALIKSPRSSRFEIVNISSPHTLQISHMLKLLLEIANKNPKIESTAQAADNKFAGLVATNEKLKQLVPNFSFRPIEHTLRDMYEWTEQHKKELGSPKNGA